MLAASHRLANGVDELQREDDAKTTRSLSSWHRRRTFSQAWALLNRSAGQRRRGSPVAADPISWAAREAADPTRPVGVPGAEGTSAPRHVGSRTGLVLLCYV